MSRPNKRKFKIESIKDREFRDDARKFSFEALTEEKRIEEEDWENDSRNFNNCTCQFCCPPDEDGNDELEFWRALVAAA